MPSYRRRLIGGGTYFFTVVTEDRAPILGTELGRRILRAAIAECMRERPFDLVAMVLLPDHLHAIWTMAAGDCDYSTRWAAIKARFTRAWLEAGGEEQGRSTSRVRHRRRGVWERKFWEHQIRDEMDLERHMHYVHFNPVKHGVAACPHGYAYSTFGKWVRRGVYEERWCCGCGGRKVVEPSFEGFEVFGMK